MDQGPIGALPVLRPDAAFHPPRRSTLRIVIYIVAMIALAFHLWHGVWSMFQTLGAPEDRDRSLGRWFATIFTILVTLGFITVPLAVLTGFLKSP